MVFRVVPLNFLAAGSGARTHCEAIRQRIGRLQATALLRPFSAEGADNNMPAQLVVLEIGVRLLVSAKQSSPPAGCLP